MYLSYWVPTVFCLVEYERQSVLTEGHHGRLQEGREERPGPVLLSQVVGTSLGLAGGGHPAVHHSVHPGPQYMKYFTFWS